MSKKRFFYHYNKPASKQVGKAMVSVHVNKTCHIVDGSLLRINCPNEGKVNPKKQPHFVMQGWCDSVTLTHEGGIIIQ